MKYEINDPSALGRRRNLRRNQTDAERLLWRRLRNRQIAGRKFFRQYSMGSYILDFYCPEAKLAIELDGSQHMDAEQDAYDQRRTAYLEKNGVKVRRYWNNDVMANIESVVEDIFNLVTPPASS